MSDMSKRIYNLRKEQNKTLEDIAKIVGVGKSTVRKWETGMIANMRRDKIAKLAEALNTTPAYLMGWEDETEKKKNTTTSEPDKLSQKEKQLILDFRSLNSQGQELILQQMFMAKEVYKKDTNVSDVEIVG